MTESEKAKKMKEHYAARAAETQNPVDKKFLKDKADAFNLKKRNLNLDSQLSDDEPGTIREVPGRLNN